MPQVIEGRDEVDLKRHALFCAFGFGYLGCFQYYLYNVKFVQVRRDVNEFHVQRMRGKLLPQAASVT